MRVRILVLLAALTTGACAQVMMPNGRVGKVMFLQRGVILQVVHTCTDHGKLYQAGGATYDILGAEPQSIPLMPALYGDTQVSATFQTLDVSGKVVNVYSASFYIDQNSTTTQMWVISNSNNGGSGRGQYNRCSG